MIELAPCETNDSEVERRQFIYRTYSIGTNLMRLGGALACIFLSYSLYVAY
jgi:hypothetical protein